MDDRYVGIIDFLRNNPNDNYPWLGLLMIHGDYHALGCGKKAYQAFEEKLKLEGLTYIRLGVIEQNATAKAFWKALGFKLFDTRQWKGRTIKCLKKQIT